MSRGLGKLQRALLAELDKRESGTTAIELTMATQLGGPSRLNRSHLVAVRRALHGLHKLGLVGLQHDGLRSYRSEALGCDVSIGAEVLCAWLPAKHGKPHLSRYAGGLNPKRCVPRITRATQHIDPTEET